MNAKGLLLLYVSWVKRIGDWLFVMTLDHRTFATGRDKRLNHLTLVVDRDNDFDSLALSCTLGDSLFVILLLTTGQDERKKASFVCYRSG
jgi:hypothetical protein